MASPRLTLVFIAVLSGASLTFGPIIGAQEKSTTDQIDQVIRMMGSQKFADREIAVRQLDGLGPSALEPLRQASNHDDPEIRRRARELVDKIDKRLLTARLLAPEKIRLNYKDEPLDRARADFAHRTGAPLKIEGEMGNGGLTPRQANRKITVETGEVPFWVAFDEFCRETGLVERNLLPKKPAKGTAEVEKLRDHEVRVMIMRQQQILAIEGAANPGNLSNPFHLAEGTGPILPTCQTSAIRVRALPPNMHVVGPSKAADEIKLALEATPQPKMSFQRIVDVRIERAVDDKGQDLSQVWEPVQWPWDGNDLRNVVFLDDDWNSDMLASLFRQVAVRLKVGENPSKTIKELRGALSVQVQTPPEPLVTVPNVLKAAGESYEGLDGRSISVAKVDREPNGRVHIRVEMHHPPSSATAAMGVVGGRVIRRGGARLFVDSSFAPPTVSRFELLDRKGNVIVADHAETRAMRQGNEHVQDSTMSFTLRDSSEYKLVFTGQRTVVIDVPFSLKDVPVP
jgi:hypothetical protein